MSFKKVGCLFAVLMTGAVAAMNISTLAQVDPQQWADSRERGEEIEDAKDNSILSCKLSRRVRSRIGLLA